VLNHGVSTADYAQPPLLRNRGPTVAELARRCSEGRDHVHNRYGARYALKLWGGIFDGGPNLREDLAF
jgi:hypothetical protein